MTELKVDGMTCGHCASTVKKAVAGVAPGADVQVDLPSGKVRIHGAPDEATVKAAIRDAGYPVA